MIKLNGFGWCVVGLVAVVIGTVTYLVMPEKPRVDISVEESNDGVDRSEQIKANFTDLAANCPSALKAKSIVAKFEQGEALMWRNEDLGWQKDFYFKIDDRRGETHHFYIRDDGHRELMVFAKQSSLDWCRINKKMHNYYLIKL